MYGGQTQDRSLYFLSWLSFCWYIKVVETLVILSVHDWLLRIERQLCWQGKPLTPLLTDLKAAPSGYCSVGLGVRSGGPASNLPPALLLILQIPR